MNYVMTTGPVIIDIIVNQMSIIFIKVIMHFLMIFPKKICKGFNL